MDIDAKKVLKGLNHCINDLGCYKECPYYDPKDPFTSCDPMAVMRDAYELIKRLTGEE